MVKRGSTTKWGDIRWICQCSCGTAKVVSGNSLRRGTTKSCGCLRDEIVSKTNRLSSGLASMRAMIKYYKHNAKKKGQEYSLTEEQFFELTQKDCYYCGVSPNSILKSQNRTGGDYIYNGLDRIDNKKGYTIDNIVSCCKFCNYAKNIRTEQEFKDWVKKIYNKMYN